MAKLNKQAQKQTEAAESSSFDPVPDGVYYLKLVDVDTTREGPAGPYWSWEFDIVESDDHNGRKQWNNTSLSEKAAFKMKETFEAFGVPLDTDTDDMLGMVVKGQISQRVIQSGDRKGEIGNQIDRLRPAEPEVIERIQKAKEEAKAAEEIF